MTTETQGFRGLRRGVFHRLAVAAILLVVGAITATWAWNTIVPDLSGLARFRFVEGLSVAIAAMLFGALFETGRNMVHGVGRQHHAQQD